MSHGTSAPWNVMLEVDEKRKRQNSMQRSSPYVIKQSHQKEDISKTPKYASVCISVYISICRGQRKYEIKNMEDIYEMANMFYLS